MKPYINIILKAVAAFLIIFFLADLLLIRPVTDTTAPVVHKKLVHPSDSGDSPYAIILSLGPDVWMFRIRRELYHQIEPGQQLYLTRWNGLLSGHTYRVTLTANEDAL